MQSVYKKFYLRIYYLKYHYKLNHIKYLGKKPQSQSIKIITIFLIISKNKALNINQYSKFNNIGLLL